MSLTDFSLKVSNFKCFADEPQGFDTLKPINIIIGRNNSGKSTLLDLMAYATRPSSIEGRGHKGRPPAVFISTTLTEDHFSRCLSRQDTRLETQRYSWTINPFAWARCHLLNK